MIRLQLLGGVSLHAVGHDTDIPRPRRRALALAVVLAAAAPQPVPRDKLLALLWPDSDTARARSSLRQAMFALRRELHEQLFLPETPGGLQLDPAQIQVDLCAFRAALSRGELERAVEAYGGRFLDGFHVPGLSTFSQWCDLERDRLQREYVGALDALAVAAEREGRAEDLVGWRTRQAAADPLSSHAALALLRALAAAGDRTGAIKYAASHERLIRQELEVDPNPEVAEFVASLRRDPTLGTFRITPGAPMERSIPRTPLPSVHPSSPASATVSVEPVAARRWNLAWLAVPAIALVLTTLGAGRWAAMHSSLLAQPTPPILVIGSGMHPVAGRDTQVELVACTGPACPEGPLPQPAFVVPANSAYLPPVAGTSYIAPAASASMSKPPGFKCCTTATFETKFRLPPQSRSATMDIGLLADNSARVAINGLSVGGMRDSLATGNYVFPTHVVTTFTPDTSGVNTLDVTLWDGGGALALQFVATVTHAVRR